MDKILAAAKVIATARRNRAPLASLDPDIVPERFQSEDLAAALSERARPGERILLARADRGRDVVREALAGAHEVEQIALGKF